MCPPGWCWTSTVTAMALHPFRSGTAYVGRKAMGLWLHEGGTGRQLASGVGWIASIFADLDRRDRLLVGGGKGWMTFPHGAVVLSEDGGGSWRPLGANGDQLPFVWDLAVCWRTGRLAAATHGGVFVLEATPRENRPVQRGGPVRR